MSGMLDFCIIIFFVAMACNMVGVWGRKYISAHLYIWSYNQPVNV